MSLSEGNTIVSLQVHSVKSSVRITRCMNLIQFWKLRQGILQQLETKALAEAAQIPTVEPRATYQGSDTTDEAGESQKKVLTCRYYFG